MSERLNMIVEDGISDMLTTLAEGERKRGQWISNLVKNMYEQRQQFAVSDVEQLRVSFAGLVGMSKILEGRVIHLEQQVAALMADRE